MHRLAPTTLLMLLMLGVAPASAAAQPPSASSSRWSPAERAVWAAVERGWRALQDEDVPRFIDSLHPQFLGWNMDRPAPLDVAAERRGTEEFLARYDWEGYTIEPVAIRIVGEDAIVHYRYRERVRPAGGGAVQQDDGRATQVLRRTGGRWKTLTIMSGSAPQDR
jgi:ketosteroid isomerase-like protein